MGWAGECWWGGEGVLVGWGVSVGGVGSECWWVGWG